MTGESSDRRLRALLYVNRLVIANPTGVQRYTFELAEALAKADSEFAVELCSGRTRDPSGPLDVAVCELRWPRRATHLAWVLFHRPAIERAAGRADLLHLSSPYFPVPSKAPAVVTVHDMLPFQHPEWYSRGERILFKQALSYYARSGAEIITPSRSVADDVTSIAGIGRDRVTVVHEGLTPGYSTPVDDQHATAVCQKYGVSDRPYFLALGGISARKNLGIVFDALDLLRATGVPARLVVVGGDRPFASQTYGQAEASGAAELITFTGRLPDDEVRALMSRAVAHLHPSLAEGFGLTTLEAMACGTPCVASTAGALPEIVGDAGLLVDPLDAQAWADAMARLLDDSALRDRLRAKGLSRSAGFSWQQAAEETVDVYRRVVG